MTLQNRCDSERKAASRLANLQLPNSYKKIGISLALFGFLALIINRLQLESEQLRFISRHGMLIGFLFISLAKDKIEDEFIKNLRMQSYAFAFIFCVAYSIGMPYLDYFVDIVREKSAVLKDSGDFMILWMLLCVQVFYFEYLKRINK